MIGGTTGRSPIAPVDLAQASIGPGMAIYSRYEGVLNQDGSRMSVHDALVLINREISEYLNPDAGDFDADTRFCAQWFEQYGWKNGPFGEAEAGALLAAMPEKGEKVRQLAYHLYTICDRNKWAEDARPYNDLVAAWSGIVMASSGGTAHGEQTEMELE